MTLLFCDIRGLTEIAERLKPEEITRLINRFLTPMTEEILAHAGTIDKYMGDNVMAFWNAPLDDPDHVRHACETALAMRRRLRQLNDELKQEAAAGGRDFRPIRMGIGLNAGICCVGNMGSDQRFDYSVLGDHVNLASRLEGQCKTYGVDTIVGESVHETAPDLPALELDLIRVKGKSIPVRIFALLEAAPANGGQDFTELARLHGEMIAGYHRQDWATARALLAACETAGQAFGLGETYALYAERFDQFEAEPPSADWDGVYEALSK